MTGLGFSHSQRTGVKRQVARRTHRAAELADTPDQTVRPGNPRGRHRADVVAGPADRPARVRRRERDIRAVLVRGRARQTSAPHALLAAHHLHRQAASARLPAHRGHRGVRERPVLAVARRALQRAHAHTGQRFGHRVLAPHPGLPVRRTAHQLPHAPLAVRAAGQGPPGHRFRVAAALPGLETGRPGRTAAGHAVRPAACAVRHRRRLFAVPVERLDRGRRRRPARRRADAADPERFAARRVPPAAGDPLVVAVPAVRAAARQRRIAALGRRAVPEPVGGRERVPPGRPAVRDSVRLRPVRGRASRVGRRAYERPGRVPAEIRRLHAQIDAIEIARRARVIGSKKLRKNVERRYNIFPRRVALTVYKPMDCYFFFF